MIFPRSPPLTRYMRFVASGLRLGCPVPEVSRAYLASGEGASAAIRSLAGKLESGESLARAIDSMPGRPDWLPGLLVHGQATGTLDAALDDAAELIEDMLTARRRVKVPLIYPLILLALTGLLFLFAIVFLFPQFQSINQGLGVPAGVAVTRTPLDPILTVLVSGSLDLWRVLEYIPFGEILPVLVLVLLWILFGGGMPAIPPDPWNPLSCHPGVRRVWCHSARARACSILARALSGDQPLADALSAAAPLAGDPGSQRAFARMAGDLARGGRIPDRAAALEGSFAGHVRRCLCSPAAGIALATTAADEAEAARETLEDLGKVAFPVTLTLAGVLAGLFPLTQYTLLTSLLAHTMELIE